MDKEKLHILQDSVNQYRRSLNWSKVPSLNQRLNSAKNKLGHLLDNLNRINRLNQTFKEVMQPPLADHCRVAHWRENVLVLAVDSSQWANRLRFEKLNILTQLRQQGFHDISSIDVIVQPDDF